MCATDDLLLADWEIASFAQGLIKSAGNSVGYFFLRENRDAVAEECKRLGAKVRTLDDAPDWRPFTLEVVRDPAG